MNLDNMVGKIHKLILKNKILVFILLLSLFLRLYNFRELFYYAHDQDLAGWMIKDIVVDHHLRLIGQETSTRGIFIGPVFYYLLIPFYILFNMDPIGGIFMAAILGVFATFSFYFIFSRIFYKSTGIVAAVLHAVSFYTIFTEREVVPTMSVFLWSIWFFYGIYLLLKGKQKYAYPLLGFLIGLIWNLIFALVLIVPVIPLAQYLSRKKINFRNLGLGLGALFATSLPLLVFEVRHGFSQTLSLVSALTTKQEDIFRGSEKILRAIYLVSKDLTGLLWGSTFDVRFEYVLVVALLVFIFVTVKKVIPRSLSVVMAFWIFLFIAFFSLYSKTISEYYFNGMMVVWIGILSIGISFLLSKKTAHSLGILVVGFFIVVNFHRIFTIPINRSGYIYKKALIADIKKDAEDKEYPCVSVSYITDPGYDLGYRYFFWLSGMHVNRPSSGSPVYTIVFPLKDIFPTNKTFGAIGLIYPDYARYNIADVAESCSGENSNVTDPMFGFTN